MSDCAIKTTKVNGITFASCGTVSDIQKLIDAYMSDSKEMITLDANAIVACDRGVFKIGMTEGDGLWENKLNYNYASGSGGLLQQWILANQPKTQ